MFMKIIGYVRGKLSSSEISTEKLILRGLTVGKNFNRQDQCVLDPSHCWLISIGDNVTLAPRVYILAHDASTKLHLNYTKIGRVSIGNNVFIGAGSIVLPNVTIGDNVIIGCGSVITKDVPDNSLVGGNPARVIGNLEEYLSKNKQLLKTCPKYDGSYTINGNINEVQKEKMKKDLEGGFGYIV